MWEAWLYETPNASRSDKKKSGIKAAVHREHTAFDSVPANDREKHITDSAGNSSVQYLAVNIDK